MGKGLSANGGTALFISPLPENEFQLHSIYFHYIALEIIPIPKKGTNCMIPHTWSHKTITVRTIDSTLAYKRTEASTSLHITFLPVQALYTIYFKPIPHRCTFQTF
ncbi:hypothetical protein Cpin_6548 [Chitinophaga pinensis DSM 2588]|uniref:Uncharacterized protein n=1 Tax=Chitinophaga pinensis (strain ATCC 43595 / DSM 2588 / LMG 13176 / NBRC 15968 / NCIMB 11800 / UQM 2034) TaxID=485918 RepID=A0A979GTQ3_CHIPD|nr:hypothetical protein Cpin_6548 [Chitinophaga pinensis DSM 2588]